MSPEQFSMLLARVQPRSIFFCFFPQQCSKKITPNFILKNSSLMTNTLTFPFLGRLQMWQLLAAAYWMLLLGTIYGNKKGTSTNPEANMNIVSHSLKKTHQDKALSICLQLRSNRCACLVSNSSSHDESVLSLLFLHLPN
jgi:hypothetical protein